MRLAQSQHAVSRLAKFAIMIGSTKATLRKQALRPERAAVME